MEPAIQLPINARRRTTLTYEGRWWLVASAVLWLTGWLKGINLILLLAYLLILLLGLNWLVSRRALRGVSARRIVRDPIFAGVPVAWETEIAVDERHSTVGWEVLDEGPDHAVRWFLVNAVPGEARHLRQDVTLPHRGPYECRPVRAMSSFPFGLVGREVELGSTERFMVLPRLGRLHVGRLRRWLEQSARPDERARRSRRRLALEAEFHGLRQFRPGDSPRWIHWRTSARTGELVVREFDHGTHYDLVLIVEPFFDGRDSVALEACVSLAATICWAWSREAGDRVALAVAGASPAVLTGGDGPAAAIELMEVLAAAQGSDQTDAESLGRRLLELPLPPGPALMVSSRADSPTAQVLSRILDRPVAFLSAGRPPAFYQPPA